MLIFLLIIIIIIIVIYSVTPNVTQKPCSYFIEYKFVPGDNWSGNLDVGLLIILDI